MPLVAAALRRVRLLHRQVLICGVGPERSFFSSNVREHQPARVHCSILVDGEVCRTSERDLTNQGDKCAHKR